MFKKHKIVLISLFLLILLSISVNAKQTITQNGFTIEAKNSYNCEPIFRNDKCLIIADFLIINNQNTNKYIYLDSSFSDGYIVVDGYKDKKDNKYYTTEETKTKDKIKIDKYSNKTFMLYFWAKIDGKFDIIINNNNILTILDPYYNTTINASSPSYYLIDGDVITPNDNTFKQRVDISAGLSDGLNTTLYTINSILLNETTINWNNQICGVNFNNNVDCNLTALDTLNTSGVSKFHCWNVTKAIKDDFQKLSNTSSFILKSPEANLYNNDNFYTKETAVLTRRPFLNITYKIGATQYTKILQTANSENLLDTYVNMGSPTINYGTGVGMTIRDYITIANRGYIRYNTTFLYKNATSIEKAKECNYLYSDGTTNSISIYHLNPYAFERKAIKPTFNRTIDTNNQYWLKIKKISSGISNITVLPYINSTTINLTNYIIYSLHSGFDTIPLTSILYNGYDANLGFRIYTNNDLQSISEIQLIEAINDNEKPKVNYCAINETSVDCNSSVRFYCNITDDSLVDKVYFGINHSTYFYEEVDKILDIDIFYTDILLNQIINGSANYTFQIVNATDSVGNDNITYPNLKVEYTCYSICSENWVIDTPICLYNDSYFKTYTDINACGTFEELPLDNGTWAYCDYCTPIPTNTSCIKNNSLGYIIEYDYLNCFSLTNLQSDNFTNITYPCYPLQTDLIISYFTHAPEYNTEKDKISWLVEIPNDYKTMDFECLTYIKKDNQTIQINPEKNIEGFVRVTQETRETFSSKDGLINVYFTGKNLKLDGQEYIYGVICSSENATLISEYYAIPQYTNLDNVNISYLWLMSNMYYIIGGLILLFIIVLTARFIWSQRN